MTTRTLSDRMDFDHVVQVHDDGTVTDADNVYAPDLYDEELQGTEWSLLDGYSGQYGYSGPMMHPSEYIGGGLARDILAQPGYYVSLVAYDENGEDFGWAVAYKEKVQP